MDCKGHRYEKAMILLCVRWYLAHLLSDRNLEEMMVERSVAADHTNVHRWVQKFTPLLEARFRRRESVFSIRPTASRYLGERSPVDSPHSAIALPEKAGFTAPSAVPS